MNKTGKPIRFAFIALAFVAFALMSFYAKSNFNGKVKNSVTATVRGGDEDAILKYIKDNKLVAQKTASGLYYVVDKQGTGAKVEKGKTVSVNYTGKLLNGTAFDSSVDPAFGHQSPISFPVGVGRVIPGWDEGLLLFNVGGKGTLIIPSALAYGSNPPTPKIPANSPLVFTIEIMGVQ
jgi:FKBP-type peptidyl-prolyl cis-trans isomerase FkpA